MAVQGNPLVFVVLVMAIAATGVSWFAWSRNPSRVIRRFAESRGLVRHDGDPDGLEARVNECVALAERELTRSFSGFGDIVVLGRGTLFRAVELLDLNRYGRAEYTNQSRVGAWLRRPGELEGFFSVSPEMEVHQRYPEAPSRVEVVQAMLVAARLPAPPCMLSLTFTRGEAVACLEPAVVRTVTHRHLEYLLALVGALGR